MPPNDDDKILETYEGLSNALSLVYDALAAARKALLENPTKEQRRKLQRRIARLEAERAEISAKLDALADGETDVKGPTAAQVAQIAVLTREVGAMTEANLAASKVLAVTTKILALAAKIADA